MILGFDAFAEVKILHINNDDEKLRALARTQLKKVRCGVVFYPEW